MQTSILLKATGKPVNKPIVINSGLTVGRKYSTSIAARLFGSLPLAWFRTRCLRTAGNIFRALLSSRVALFAAAAVGAVMYYHALTIADTVAMQRAIATDLLFLLPWAGAWLLRSIKKGGAR